MACINFIVVVYDTYIMYTRFLKCTPYISYTAD